MKSVCGAECDRCGYGRERHCRGCEEFVGCPFGKPCFIFQYIKIGGKEHYELLKKQLIKEFNLLQIPGMPNILPLGISGSFNPFATETENASIARPTPRRTLFVKKIKSMILISVLF